MTKDESHGWSRRRFLAGTVGTSAFAALSRDVSAAQAAPPSGGTAQAQALPAGAQDRISARLRLMRVALGQEPSDLVITDGTLLDTLTGELLPGWGVAIAGDRIAAVGNVERCVGASTVRISAKGLTLVPGFVDAHYHCESSRVSARRHAEVTLPQGLTAYFEGTHEIANAGRGLPGVEYFVEAGRRLPQKIYPCVSSATPPSPVETTSGYIGYAEAALAFERWPEEARGIDEVMDLPRVLDGSARLHAVIQAALDGHRVVAGHGSPPLDALDGWIAAGIMSSHSPRVAEALTMLRKGVHLQLKTERTAEIIKQLLDLPLRDWRNVGLAVDDRTVADLLDRGGMDHEVRTAIAMGVPAITAYQMATVNNAAHWQVSHLHGLIAPGRYADVLLVSDLEKVVIDRVFASGRLVAEKGRLTGPLDAGPLDPSLRNTVRLSRELRASDFEILAPPNRGDVQAYVLPPRYFSLELGPITKTLRVSGSRVQRDLARGITKFAVVERYGKGMSIGVSFWELGFDQGAIAWTVNHDHHNLGVLGATDEDMAVAANRCAAIEGGYVIVKDGKVLAELALPIAGLMSDDDPVAVAEKIRRLDKVATELHPASSLAQHPTDQITFMNLTCDPWKYSLTDLGLFNLQTQERMPVVF
ncbi:MAG TPA: adenine deaminase C-terminal domain-containing protein [Vicinamibacterales bacterium]|jgi:adenine deaminase|nr:adenine deaminase C-terminal domain-containing protein [Vicinamibacterales bacterium]